MKEKNRYKIIFPLFAILVIFISCRTYLARKQRKDTKVEIEKLVTYHINGYDSKVLVRGKHANNPVLLCVHGLGYSDMMFSRCYDQGLLDEFTVVRYDQRGIGKSKNKTIPDSLLTIENYISDLLSLTDSIQMLFPNSRIYLLGHSWGTIIGIKAVFKAPEKYACYVGMGQIVNQKEADIISYDYALNKAQELKKEDIIASLIEMDREQYNQNSEQLSLQRKYLKELGGTYFNNEVIGSMKKCVIRSPEHRMLELYLTPKRAKRIDGLLFPQILDINFSDSISNFEIPTYFLGGRHDYIVPSVLSKKYLNSIEAPEKEFIWFENSGHLPIYEENERFISVIKKIKENLHTTKNKQH